MKYSQNKIFYVYLYLRSVATQNGPIFSPYYVGKGFKRRAFNKHKRISVPIDKTCIVFASQNMTEADAFQLEMLLIYLYGRIDLKTGCLHNLDDGGRGSSGAKRTIEHINKVLATRELRGKMNTNTPETIAKSNKTKEENGTLNPNTPQMIQKSRKTKMINGTGQNHARPEIRAKASATRKKNGKPWRSKESLKKAAQTRKNRGPYKRTQEQIDKVWATRRANLLNKSVDVLAPLRP
jgi:hypothetical protein